MKPNNSINPKMFSTSPDLPQKSLQVKQDDKFFSRLLSKESSMANPSFRVYYGGVPGAVPFMWESQPGTPKYTFCETTLPPLTPPPSYYSKCRKESIKKHSRSSLLYTLFPRMNLKKTNNVSLSPTSSSSSWSMSNSSLFVPMNATKYHGSSQFSTLGSSFDSRADDEKVTIGSPTSTLCFGINKGTSGGIRGCYGW